MPDLPHDLALMATAFPVAKGPYDLYQQTYDSTACGPTLGLKVYSEGHAPTLTDPWRSAGETRWIYCDDLSQLGDTWADVEAKGFEIQAIAISSIVEGIEATTETIEISIDGRAPETLRAEFYSAVAKIDEEADALWKETHGCDTCKAHFGKSDDDPYCPVWDECPDCQGGGVPI